MTFFVVVIFDIFKYDAYDENYTNLNLFFFSTFFFFSEKKIYWHFSLGNVFCLLRQCTLIEVAALAVRCLYHFSWCSLMYVARALFKYCSERAIAHLGTATNLVLVFFLQFFFYYWKLTMWHDQNRQTSQLYNAIVFISFVISLFFSLHTWHCTKNRVFRLYCIGLFMTRINKRLFAQMISFGILWDISKVQLS